MEEFSLLLAAAAAFWVSLTDAFLPLEGFVNAALLVLGSEGAPLFFSIDFPKFPIPDLITDDLLIWVSLWPDNNLLLVLAKLGGVESSL